MVWEKEAKKITLIIEKILEQDPRARKDDKYLTWIIMLHNNINIPFEVFEKMPSYSTIDRCRRKIQSERPELKPDKNTQIKRLIKEQQIKKWSVQ